MRQGFMYIRLQIYFVLLALVVGSALLFLTGLIHKNLQLHRQLQESALLNNVLDKMTEDIRYADGLEIHTDSVRVVLDGVSYTYFLNNQRLVRQKDAYLYLTPAAIVLQSLRFTENSGLLTVTLTGQKQNWERVIRR